MTIMLRPITQENWRPVYQLTKTLSDEQQNFVAPNAYSMLETLYDPETCTARAIYIAVDGAETLVGFLMNSYDREYDEHWIDRLMIASDYQNKSYGRAALKMVIDEFKAKPGCAEVYICFAPDNEVARKLYTSLGFLDTGKIEDGEAVYCLSLRETSVS